MRTIVSHLLRDTHGATAIEYGLIVALVALACIIGGAYLFVGAVESLAHTIGVSELLLALVIAPIATELPEKFNSLIWVRQGKDTLAMGNITGAMVFQSAIPTVVALVLAGSAWHIDGDTLIAFLSAAIAFIAVAAIFGPMWRRAASSSSTVKSTPTTTSHRSGSSTSAIRLARRSFCQTK